MLPREVALRREGKRSVHEGGDGGGDDDFAGWLGATRSGLRFAWANQLSAPGTTAAKPPFARTVVEAAGRIKPNLDGTDGSSVSLMVSAWANLRTSLSDSCLLQAVAQVAVGLHSSFSLPLPFH